MNTFPIIPTTKASLSLRKPLFGIGINDADYLTEPRIDGKRLVCPYYKKWRDMIRRCYDQKYHAKKPTYIDCSVCDSWLIFSNFRSWMIKQDWKGKELDKDLLVRGNKTYSPNACLFVSSEINALLNNRESSRGKWPLGVTFHKKDCMFHARIGVYGKLKHLGSYFTPEEAHNKYIEAKESHVRSIALDQEEPLKTALLEWRAN